jgi:glycosyltransferase involved in cell wall biosynthesis
MRLSIVIPLLNEEESLTELSHWIAGVMASNGISYEIIFIDDGSTDNSWDIIRQLSETQPEIRGIRFLRNFGKSQALHAGFKAAQGDIVATMDADLQDNPEEIPAMMKMIETGGYDMISGWKKKRYDSVLMKNLPSKLFNWAARKTSGVKLHDFNCGLKVFRKEVVKSIEVSGEMHRYIPVLAKNAGYRKIGEQVVQHQARKFGKTKFGPDRFIKVTNRAGNGIYGHRCSDFRPFLAVRHLQELYLNSGIHKRNIDPGLCERATTFPREILRERVAFL